MRFGGRTKSAARALFAAGAAWTLSIAPQAGAFEFFDGAVQVHGYLETQVRTLATNFDPEENWHLAQWYNIVNVELEWDAAPQGWGPFDMATAFVRLEGRYDCVWTGGCGMVPAHEVYGNGAERLPKWISNGRKRAWLGTNDPSTNNADPTLPSRADRRNLIRLPIQLRGDEYGPGGLDVGEFDKRHLGNVWNLPSLGLLLFSSPGRDRVVGTPDDPGFYIGEKFVDYKWGVRKQRGNVDGVSNSVFGPYRPKDKVPAPGALWDRANPLNDKDLQPVLGLLGQAALPFRPAPRLRAGSTFADCAKLLPDSPDCRTEARGIFIPDAGYQRLIDADRLEFRPDSNYTQSRLEWNHGANQEFWKELKELYFDLEMFDHRLWLRLGRQNIVWGKTELFRAQDQFNPQDFGIASLPTLEESRIPRWAARGIWSFYDVGPFEDVRLEVAVNFDEFEPADLGRCGEPFAPAPACTRAFGFFGYALTGTGLAGELRPPDPWESVDGLEFGSRLEWRRGTVSFALTHYYGYEDTPYTRPVFVFERNVDPLTGRPRSAGSRAPCNPDPAMGEPDTSGCLGVAPFSLDNGEHVVDVLRNHFANQQLFHAICGATVAFTSLDERACSLTPWNSVAIAIDDPGDPLAVLSPRLSSAFSAMLQGGGRTNGFWSGTLLEAINGKLIAMTLGRFEEVAGWTGSGAGGIDEDGIPLVPLVRDPGDVSADDVAFFQERVLARGQTLPDPVWQNFWRPVGMSQYLSDPQEALLGCGRFFGSHCEVDGFDLMVSEASALFMSWPGTEGTEGGIWDTFETGLAQPGTLGFMSGSVGTTQGIWCTRFENGTRYVLPGCGAASLGRAQDVFGDGTPPSTAQFNPRPPPGFGDMWLAGHPFTGQAWASEMAALSWNALMVFVVSSVPPEEDDDGLIDGESCEPLCAANNGADDEFEVAEGGPTEGRFDQFNPLFPYALGRCSFRNPTLCSSVAQLFGAHEPQKKTVRAGGNGRFGRRDFVWHGGASAALDYQRRHVLGLAMDFAEDWSKTNWNLEFTWFHRLRFSDQEAVDLTTTSDLYNLTISIDRPTFLRVLNRSRTFFFNVQAFIQYIPGYTESFQVDGPVNARVTFGVFTGYHQDRLLPGLQVVYDVGSRSGAALWSLSYRYTQNLTVQWGINAFWGRDQPRESAIVPIGTQSNGAGAYAQRVFVENGLSPVRDRDEVFVRLRYNF